MRPDFVFGFNYVIQFWRLKLLPGFMINKLYGSKFVYRETKV